MARVILRSRSGNVVLAVLGAVYTVAAVATLVAYVIDVWKAMVFSDVLVSLILLAAAVSGVWMVLAGLQSLGVRGLPHFLHRAPGAQTTPAATMRR